MNFDFSEDVEVMRGEVRRMLDDAFPRGAVRQAVDRGERFDRAFWASIAENGWLGMSIAEADGGVGFGHEALCMIAEEIGASLAPVPFASSIFLAAEALSLFGSAAQRAAWLPRLVSGEAVGCLALAEGPGAPEPRRTGAFGADKWPVIDGDIADIAIVAANDGLWLVELDQPGVIRDAIDTLDLVRGAVRLRFDGAKAEKLEGSDWSAVERLLDRAAILTAFEQIGGARATLDMAVEFARERYAFGRPIGSFQAIKHKLADIYVALELARSNAYYGIWALDNEQALPVAASAARLAATKAMLLAAQENIQVNGGMGFTWESDCHLFYRRARALSVGLGPDRYWRDRLITHLDRAEAA